MLAMFSIGISYTITSLYLAQRRVLNAANDCPNATTPNLPETEHSNGSRTHQGRMDLHPLSTVIDESLSESEPIIISGKPLVPTPPSSSSSRG